MLLVTTNSSSNTLACLWIPITLAHRPSYQRNFSPIYSPVSTALPITRPFQAPVVRYFARDSASRLCVVRAVRPCKLTVGASSAQPGPSTSPLTPYVVALWALLVGKCCVWQDLDLAPMGIITHLVAPQQAMARRSDGPWVLSSNMMMRNNSHERDNSSFGGCGGDASRGDIFDMKGYACCGLSNTDRITITCPHLSRSLVAALCNTQDSTADVARTLARCKFSPRLPGLTKLVSKFGKEGCWRKALGVYESLHILNVIPDTAITNAAISACDKGLCV